MLADLRLIHHGQWSLYASLAGFDTLVSWRTPWSER